MKEIKAQASEQPANVIFAGEKYGESDIQINGDSQKIIIITNAEGKAQKSAAAKNSDSKAITITLKDNASAKCIDIDSKRDIRIFLGRNAKLKFYSMHATGANHKISAELMENSSISTRSVFIIRDGEENLDISVIHKEANSVSDLQNRAVLCSSKMILEGMIEINQDAGESQGFQKSDFLILGDSEAVSIPNLKISNNNVVCSHGSAISRLDAEKIFYLQSRGMSENESKQLLMEAFINSILGDLYESEERNLPQIDAEISKMKNDVEKKIAEMANSRT